MRKSRLRELIHVAHAAPGTLHNEVQQNGAGMPVWQMHATRRQFLDRFLKSGPNRVRDVRKGRRPRLPE